MATYILYDYVERLAAVAQTLLNAAPNAVAGDDLMRLLGEPPVPANEVRTAFRNARDRETRRY